MGLGSPRKQGTGNHPGEPGVGPDLAPPFVARDEATAWLFSLNRFGIRPGLSRIEGLLADLGHPEEGLRILVTAGTNGKGSTTLALDHLLRAAGFRTAAYTSPHLLNVHERICIDGHPVDSAAFATRVDDLRPLIEKNEASWFESLTALAVLEARDAGVDYLCCETGLGGRLDATNALPAVATLLTTVGLDHQSILGATLEEIAAEKLGLLKPGVPLFCGADEELRPQVFRAAVMSGSPSYFLDELARWNDVATDDRWDLVLRERVFENLPDPGSAAMRRSVALAVLALSELETPEQADLLPPDVAAALGNLFLPGRFQRVLREPDWIVDTAHNGQALESVLTSFADRYANRKKVLLFGAMADKNLADMCTLPLDGFDHVVGAPVALPRSLTADELGGFFADRGLAVESWSSRNGGLETCTVAPDLGAAISRLADSLKPDDRVLVTGSCFTVAETLHRLGFEDLDRTRTPRSAREAYLDLGKES